MKKWIIGLALVVVFLQVFKEDPIVAAEKTRVAAQKQAEAQALQDCMDKYRWDTTAVRTSRLAIAINFERMNKGELAKHISDYEAVKIVYCTPKRS